MKKSKIKVQENLFPQLIINDEEDKNEIVTIDRKAWVRQSNDFIKMPQKVNTCAKRILGVLISQVDSNDEAFKTYTFSVATLAKEFGMNPRSGKTYEFFKEALKELRRAGIEFDNGNGWIGFSYLHYRQDEGKIDIRFDKEMRKYLLQIRENYTKYRLHYLLCIDSRNTSALYEFLKSYEFIGRPFYIEMNELKKKLNIEKKYAIYADFKKRVLHPCIKEIEEKTDLKVIYKEKLVGKKVNGFTFFLSRNIDNIMKFVPEDRFSEGTLIEIPENYKLVASLLERETISPKQIYNMIQKYSPEYLKANLDWAYIQNKSLSIVNMAGFIINTCRNNWATYKPLNEHEKKQKDKKDQDNAKAEIQEAEQEAAAAVEVEKEKWADKYLSALSDNQWELLRQTIITLGDEFRNKILKRDDWRNPDSLGLLVIKAYIKEKEYGL